MATTSTDQRPQPAQIGDGEIVGEDRVKQGRSGKRIFAILAASLALVIIGFVIAFMSSPTNVADDNRGGQARTDDAAAAATFDAPEPAPKQPPPT